MRDERVKELASVLLTHSVKVKKAEKVLIRGSIITKPLITELIDQAYSMGAYPYVELFDDEINLHLAKNYKRAQLETQANWQMQVYKDVDAVIVIIGEENDAEMAGIPKEMHRLRGEIMKPVSEFYVNNRKWVLLNYPTKGLAQKAGMSTREFEDYLFSVCTVDYDKMASAVAPLKRLMEKTDQVRLVSPGTDLLFSIKDIPVIPCTGEANVPDGEIFTAPIKDSVNGTILFNTPCPYHGTTFRNVKLTFENGKITEATSDNTEKLNEILDTDEGARYIGEFAIGFNPHIEEPMGDILFDEKICGSLHFTPGEAYEEADNGNKSAVHWDMVLIQRPEYGGGEIYFDNVLIRKDGKFVLPELEGLNQENLK
jgi:aminopeptidase